MNDHDILDLICSRRSIRRYQERPVERAKLEILLKAAMAAPTAANRQPWEIVVVTEPERMDALRSVLYNGKYNAPAALVVCGNMKLAFRGQEQAFWVQDCSAAMENILIAAAGIALGTVWIGVHPLPSKIAPVRKALDIPDYVTPLGVAFVGYPAETKVPRTQLNPKRVYWQRYDRVRKLQYKPQHLVDRLAHDVFWGHAEQGKAIVPSHPSCTDTTDGS